jgi:hypothetical protein
MMNDHGVQQHFFTVGLLSTSLISSCANMNYLAAALNKAQNKRKHTIPNKLTQHNPHHHHDKNNNETAEQKTDDVNNAPISSAAQTTELSLSPNKKLKSSEEAALNPDKAEEGKFVLEENGKNFFGLSADGYNGAEEFVAAGISAILSDWNEELNKKPDKAAIIYTQESQQYKQTKDNLAPFFKDIKLRRVSPDVLSHCNNILTALLVKDYKLANEMYYSLAIGNAPWPMGVSSVSIHQRSSRERLAKSSNQIAHVLNDESQRKIIQAIKRLITFIEHKYPK